MRLQDNNLNKEDLLLTSAVEKVRAFTLIELLVVIAIIGILTTIALPSLRGLGGSNAVSSANKQLMDDLMFARLRAINQRTTVYMVFLSHQMVEDDNVTKFKGEEFLELKKLAVGQYNSYALYVNRSLSDQPGAGTPRYLTEWKTLPEGMFIATNKFTNTFVALKDGTVNDTNRPFGMINVHFPFAESSNTITLPCIAFNYQGQLIGKANEYIYLSKGSLVFEMDQSDPQKLPKLEPPEVIATPSNNFTNNPRIVIDWLTGRAKSQSPPYIYEPYKI